MAGNVDYKRAAKTTLLFSGVKVVTILVGIIKNKIAAVLLGPIGVGIVSVYNTYLHFVQNGAGLGLSQSAVRDISEACEHNNQDRFSRIISLTNHLVLFTAILGVLTTIVMSPFFSKWGFGNSDYTMSFILLSVCVGMQIYVENRLAILKGMRQMHSLAISTIISSVVGLVISAPLYFIFRQKGIIPVLLLSAFVTLIVTNIYVNKIKYNKVILSFKEIRTEGAPMLKMGIALMMINFLSSIASAIVITFLRGRGGLEVVAFYGTGMAIIQQYFGIVLTAMTTDYYPRICGVYRDNMRLSDEVNAQSKLGLIMVFPLALIFVAFASFFIPLLYSDSFIAVSQVTDWALIGTLISVPSNCIAMVLLAKQDVKAFTSISLVVNAVNVFVFIGGYSLLGLKGLGLAYALNVLIQWIVYSLVIGRRYHVLFSRNVIIMIIIVVSVVLMSVLTKRIDNILIKYFIQVILIAFSFWYALFWSKKMDIDIVQLVKNKIGRKK